MKVYLRPPATGAKLRVLAFVCPQCSHEHEVNDIESPLIDTFLKQHDALRAQLANAAEALEDLMDDCGPNTPEHWCPEGSDKCQSTCATWKRARDCLARIRGEK